MFAVRQKKNKKKTWMTDVEKKEGRHDRRWKNVNMLAECLQDREKFTERKTEITTSKRNRQRIREMNIL